MNYDSFEREVLGYQADIRCRAERRRLLSGGSASRARRSGRTQHPVRYRLAGALRNLANHLDARPASLA